MSEKKPMVLDMTHADDVIRTYDDGLTPTLEGRMGTGGNQVPLVMSHWDDPKAPHPTLCQSAKGSGSPGYSNQEVFNQRGAGLVPVQAGQGNPLILDDQGGGVMNVRADGKVGTLRSQSKHHEPIVLDAFRISSADSNGMKSANPLVGYKATDLSPTLDTTSPDPTKGQGGLAIVMSECGNDRSIEMNVSPPLKSAVHSVQMNAAAVRRLTPVECERLQGFPDNWTRIPYRGKPEELCPDSPRYKAIGNSWAVPVVRWLGKRIQKHLEGNE